MMKSDENEALVELSRCLYHFLYIQNKFIHSFMLFKLISNIFLINTLFQCRIKMTPPMDLAPSEKPLRRSRVKVHFGYHKYRYAVEFSG